MQVINKDDLYSLANVIIDLDCNDLDYYYERYPSAIVDLFDNQLSLNEYKRESIGDFENFNLKHEEKYLNFIKELYTLSIEDPVIIEVKFTDLSNVHILRILDTLDYKEKLLFVELIKDKMIKDDLFLIYDEEILKLFIKLSTRELVFSNFYFTKLGITLCGADDLNFPIFFSNKSEQMNCSKIANKYSLFLKKPITSEKTF